MKNKTLWFFLLFLCFPLSMALAVNLSEHGSDLMKASFPLRYKFEQSYHKEWTKSTLEERRNFLTQWYGEEEEAQKLKNKKLRQERVTKIRQYREKVLIERKLQKQKRDLERKLAEEHKAEVRSKRNFDRVISANERSLKRATRQQD